MSGKSEESQLASVSDEFATHFTASDCAPHLTRTQAQLTYTTTHSHLIISSHLVSVTITIAALHAHGEPAFRGTAPAL